MAELATIEELIAQGPQRVGRCELSFMSPIRKTWLAPWPGEQVAFSDAMQNAFGLALPASGEVLRAGTVSVVWVGREAAILLEAEVTPELAAHGAAVDVSDGWTRMLISGEDAVQVLARLCPVDLRTELYAKETALRTQIGHLSALVVAGRTDGVELWVMRSFAAHLHEELVTAMEGIAARAVSLG
ncbi:MAG: sarcosine oxidase subunit gamma [Dinoroseobacter sp.]|nr:sarcosine oxidase subunit gamma [Dinoroseobacter sp.]